MKNYNLSVTTDIQDGKIIQELTNQVGPDLTESMMRTIIDTKEEHVKEALIKLGWTPPKDKHCYLCA